MAHPVTVNLDVQRLLLARYATALTGLEEAERALPEGLSADDFDTALAPHEAKVEAATNLIRRMKPLLALRSWFRIGRLLRWLAHLPAPTQRKGF